MDLLVETRIGKGRSSLCFSGGDHEWVPALPQAVMRDGFILLLIVSLSSLVAAAQTPTPQAVPAQERVAPIITRLQTVPVPSPARSFVLSEDPGKSAGHKFNRGGLPLLSGSGMRYTPSCNESARMEPLGQESCQRAYRCATRSGGSPKKPPAFMWGSHHSMIVWTFLHKGSPAAAV